MRHIHVTYRVIGLYLPLLLCLIFCTNCSNNIHTSTHLASYSLADRDALLMKGYTASFADGYMDGCQSGQYAAGDKLSTYSKDERRVAIENDYSTGWVQGNSFCREHMQNLINNSGSAYYSKEAMEQEKQRMWSELRK